MLTLTGALTFRVLLDHSVMKLDHVFGLVILDMSSEDHVLVEVAGVQYACWKSNIFDVVINMILAYRSQQSNTRLSTKTLLPS